MPRANCKNELLSFLKGKPARLCAVAMPDFFFDRLISLEYDVEGFSSAMADVASRKGGSIDGIAQMNIRGGNAVNTTSALASLGVDVTPIVCTNKLGLHQIKFYLGAHSLDFSHVKVAEKASVTTALEFKVSGGKTNVMLRDVGSLADFGPADLDECDYELIESADYVCLFNWAGTKNFGTKLAETVFGRVKAGGKGKTYYDTADPTPNRDGISGLMRNVLQSSHVDILSLNENEAVCYAAMLSDDLSEKQGKERFDELALEAARILAKHLPARIDLHTTVFSGSFTKRGEVVVPAFKVKALRATGAGDSWDAGNIFGDGNGLSAECRLMLANAVAACYLSGRSGAHPTRMELVKFVENAKFSGQVLR